MYFSHSKVSKGKYIIPNSKHETKDAEYHELQELFHMLHISSNKNYENHIA